MTGTKFLEALPVAVYTTDPEGRITFFNKAAADLWGCSPELGTDKWCGSWRLFWPDGSPLRHEDCPMGIALREGRELRGVEAVAERPDGTRVPFIPYPSLLRDSEGNVTGAINLLVDITWQKLAEIDSARLAAIVESSDDAIVSKTLEGRITSWNAGAARIFGYQPDEMIGQSIRQIIPPELHSEEDEIIAKLKSGERIDHYDTVRVAKDGRRIEISLTISPLRDSQGNIVGASKVARDITERKRAEELQRLLLHELSHRVKNTLATIQAIASQSLRRAASPSDFVASFSCRLQALAQAHGLLVRQEMEGADLIEIVREQVMLGSDANRIACSGPLVWMGAEPALQLALVLHELSTNARKYGALSVPDGRLSIAWDIQGVANRQLFLEWRESGVPALRAPSSAGFGTTLIDRTLKAQGGNATMRYGADGLVCEMKFPLRDGDLKTGKARKSGGADLRADLTTGEKIGNSAGLRGKHILVVEDEPLIAMEMEAQLMAEGCEVVGPASSLEEATALISGTEGIDAALLDANLAGQPVYELAAALTQRSIPFAFATGYGRDGLHPAFQEAPVIAKPFGPNALKAALTSILRQNDRSPDVVSMRRKS